MLDFLPAAYREQSGSHRETTLSFLNKGKSMQGIRYRVKKELRAKQESKANQR